MRCQTSRLLLVTALAWAVTAAAGQGQPPKLPPAPVPVSPGPPVIAGPVIPPPLPPPPGPPLPAPPPGPGLLEDRNGLLMPSDPLLDRPCSPPPGWFAAVDVALVKPHVKNRLVEPLAFPDVLSGRLHVPQAELDWTGTPRLELGYRFPQGFGEVLLAYRSVVSEGGAELIDSTGGAGFLKSRLDMNVIDLDYGSWEYALGPFWDMRWKAGVRVATVFFDSRATVDLFPGHSGIVAGARASNFFVGAGPHAGLQLFRKLGATGLSLYAGLEGAVVIGSINQSFEETLTFDALGGRGIGAAANQDQVQAVPVLGLEAGLRWAPRNSEHVRFTLGYQFEAWWYVGDVGDSRAEVTDQGFFFRSEFNF